MNLEIKKLYIINVLGSFWFVLPVMILYLQAFGLTYFQIAILEVVSALTVILMEIPTGIFADSFGKKWALFFGCISWMIALFVIGTGSSFPVFLVGFFVWAVGDAFFSGSTQALVYEIVKSKREFLKIQGNFAFLGSLALIVGSVAGAKMFDINERLPWVIYSLFMAVAAVFSVMIREPKTKARLKSVSEHTQKSFKLAFGHDVLRFLIIFSVLTYMPLHIFTNLAEQPYLISVGFSVTQLGMIYAITRGFVGLLLTQVSRIEEKVGKTKSFIFLSVGYSVIFIVLGMLTTQIALLFIIMLYFMRDYQDIVVDAYFNRHINSQNRATLLSIKNMSISVASIVYSFLGGIMLDHLSMNTALILLGTITFAIIFPYVLSNFKKK